MSTNHETYPTVSNNAKTYLQSKVDSLKASIDTLDDQIKRLKNYVSYLQLRSWRDRRANLNKSYQHYKQLLKNEKT